MPKSTGENQFQKHPFIKDYPNLPAILQLYINEGALQKDIVEMLKEDHDIDISLRSIQRLMKKFEVQTTRRNDLTPVEMGAAILAAEVRDPLGRVGNRKLKERLGLKGEHIPRDFIQDFRREANSAGAAARHPITRKVHFRGITCSGPNEEWCVDGHEKLTKQMGISVWGIIDKYSRLELCLQAVPNARHLDVPLTLYLQTIQKLKGIPLSTASDKGGELGPFIAMQNALRQRFLPALDINLVPPHTSVTSTYNITRERGWRPIWEKNLSNVLQLHNQDSLYVGFFPENPLHESVRLWVWGKAVQWELDDIMRENKNHRIRKQKDIFLPSGGRPIDFYRKPAQWGGTNQLIEIPPSELDRLTAEYSDPTALQFGAPAVVTALEMIWEEKGKPDITPLSAWAVWRIIVDQAIANANVV